LKWCCCAISLFAAFSAGHAAANPAFRRAVEEDWARQEMRLNRTVDSEAAVQDVVRRATLLLNDLASAPNAPDFSAERETLAQLSARAGRASEMDTEGRRGLYLELRWLARDAALRNPLLGDGPLFFMQRRRFICQMLHEYLGYYYDYADIEGGGVYVLEKPGRSFEKRELVQGRLPRGNYSTLALSYDAKTLYFAFAARADGAKPDYYSPERRCFHLHAMDADGSNLRPLTHGPDDDFDPCPLPDGALAFMSSRRGGFTRCNNPWEPLPAHTLHRLERDGTVRALSVHETSEWHPQVLNDGRIAYTRWDYVDRSAAHFHGIWVTNPDGTNSRQLFGNYTQRINACYQAHPIPGSQRIAFLAGAHHANVGGSLVLLDPARTALDTADGGDDFAAIEPLTPEVCFPETPDVWPDSYYHSPWPLSENYFLISYSFDPLPGMSALTKEDTETGLYLRDRFGNLELLYREAGISSMYPIPARPRPAPPVVPSALDPAMGDAGEFLLGNVRTSHLPFPPEREIKALRIFQILPKSKTHVANKPRLGYANAESARMLLGTVPVEADGSAYFRAPALKPLAFQAVDASGRAVQGMRSAAYLQPGERRSCVGCHESTAQARGASPGTVMAARRAPSPITPGPDGSMPWSFTRLMQPILDQRCASCHEKDAKPRLTGREADEFSESYAALQPYARWYEWGDKSISVIVSRPGEMPGDMSPLPGILRDANHATVRLTDEEWRTIYLWLDANGAFYGAYSEIEQVAQRKGQAIPPPALQ
jgi:mono/diheme cytochrome c family protein